MRKPSWSDIMPGLRELQCRMRDALLDETSSELDAELRNGQLSVAQHIAIYRNNVFTNLREALRTLFPVTEQLVGADFFNYLADAFIRSCASPAGDLNRFGGDLGQFISNFAPAAELPYLPDVARLEWLVHTVYHARDCAGFDPMQLVSVNPDDYARLHFELNPAVALFASDYPVHRIWQTNQPGYHGETSVDLNSGTVQLMVTRRRDTIELTTTPPGTWALLNAIARQADFAHASEVALQADPELDLGTCLSELIAKHALVGFHLGSDTELFHTTFTQEELP